MNRKSPAPPVFQERSEISCIPGRIDLIVFSQIRWDFVWQRPQHLMSRWARERRVYYVEEPVCNGEKEYRLDLNFRERRLRVIVPRLAPDCDPVPVQKRMLDMLFRLEKIENYMLWYLTPMAAPFTAHLKPKLTVYDCMDELSAFAGAPQSLRDYESELLLRSDIVFTGGMSLYKAKQHRHANIHPFPSSIDYEHFHRARLQRVEPADQKNIPYPRIGFFGVIDERMDRELIDRVAELRRDWHIVLLGPTTKIDPATLPRRPNIHYLGHKQYAELPDYISGWDVAILPFARNESTRFISPTKTPEYLAAGKPVVSTSVHDVVRPYGDLGLVHIADEPVPFVKEVEAALQQVKDRKWLERVDHFLAGISWDRTWDSMKTLMAESLRRKSRVNDSDEDASHYGEVTNTGSASVF